MTDTKHRAPPHGGLQRVSFNGGDTIRRQLPFRAIAVNIDNWSPYWYKLNPVEEYIPPFQHGINIRLPLIDDYEFVPIAPPGLQQTNIVATTGIPGNSKPLIAVFSSYDTNNDAGLSALQASANIGVPFISFVGAQSVDIDLTIYDGLYLSLTSSARFVVEIDYLDNPTSAAIALYRRILHINTRLFLVIPKVTRFVRIIISADPNRPIAIGGSYSARPFFGSLPFSAQLLPAPNSVVVPQDSVPIIGSNTVNFTVTGLENAYLTVLPAGGAGVTINTVYWIKVYATNLSNITRFRLYNRVFYGNDLAGEGPAGLILPLNDLLTKQIDQVTVFVLPNDAGVTLPNAQTDISLHQGTTDTLDIADYSPPSPFIFRLVAVGLPAGTTLAGTVPVGGTLMALAVVINAVAAGATNILFFLGSNVLASIYLGEVVGNVLGNYMIQFPQGIRLDSGLSSIWFTAGVGGATVTAGLYIT